MPAPRRAILADIAENNLDPKVAYSDLDKSGKFFSQVKEEKLHEVVKASEPVLPVFAAAIELKQDKKKVDVVKQEEVVEKLHVEETKEENVAIVEDNNVEVSQELKEEKVLKQSKKKKLV